jgi:Na+-driven multidrug efflux pump
MDSERSNAVAGIVITSLLVLFLTIGVVVYRETLGENYYFVLAACFSLMLCVYPPAVATYVKLDGRFYSYENYIVQVFSPMMVGFFIFLCMAYFAVLKDFDVLHQQFILLLGSASILSSVLVYTYILYRIKYNGT